MWFWFSVGVIFSCSCLKTKVVFSSYQALPDSLLLKESVSIYINALWRRAVLVCREFMSGHGLHGACSITGYKGGGEEESLVWTSVWVCTCFQQGRCIFVSELEALLYKTVLLMLLIFTQMYFPPVFWHSSVGHAGFLKWSDVTSRTSVPIQLNIFHLHIHFLLDFLQFI